MKKQKIEKSCDSNTYCYSNTRGITLVALVITIIVLLILAGVAIRAVVGDNGVLNQSTQASKKTNYSKAKETAEMQIEYIESGENAGKANLTITEQKIQDLIDSGENPEIESVNIKEKTDKDGNKTKYIEVKLTNNETVEIPGVEQKVGYQFTVKELLSLDVNYDTADSLGSISIEAFESLVGASIDELIEGGYIYIYDSEGKNGIINANPEADGFIGALEYETREHVLGDDYLLQMYLDGEDEEIEIFLVKKINDNEVSIGNNHMDADEVVWLSDFREEYDDTLITLDIINF